MKNHTILVFASQYLPLDRFETYSISTCSPRKTRDRRYIHLDELPSKKLGTGDTGDIFGLSPRFRDLQHLDLLDTFSLRRWIPIAKFPVDSDENLDTID